MSGTDECQSTVSESHVVRSNIAIDQSCKTQLDTLNDAEMVPKGDRILETLNGNNCPLERYSVSVSKEEIMDSEVSSITSKDKATIESINSSNDADEIEEKSPDATSISGRISNEFETAALSPCFPLIRDRQELENEKTEMDPPVSSDNEDIKSEQKSSNEDSLDNLEKTIDKDPLEPQTKEVSCDQLEQTGKLEAENVADVDKDGGSKAVNDNIHEETEESKCKDNIVSSSLDKNNDVMNEKEGPSSTKGIW